MMGWGAGVEPLSLSELPSPTHRPASRFPPPQHTPPLTPSHPHTLTPSHPHTLTAQPITQPHRSAPQLSPTLRPTAQPHRSAPPLSPTPDLSRPTPQRYIRISIEVQLIDMCKEARDNAHKYDGTGKLFKLIVRNDAISPQYPEPLVGEIPFFRISDPKPLLTPLSPSAADPPQIVPPQLQQPIESYPSYHPTLPLTHTVPLVQPLLQPLLQPPPQPPPQ